jgi:hypothetical protein
MKVWQGAVRAAASDGQTISDQISSVEGFLSKRSKPLSNCIVSWETSKRNNAYKCRCDQYKYIFINYQYY